jgi:hypothetical protein
MGPRTIEVARVRITRGGGSWRKVISAKKKTQFPQGKIKQSSSNDGGGLANFRKRSHRKG